MRTGSFTASDGTKLVWRETGEGRPVLLLHGLFSNAETNWIKFGHAERIATAGFRVIMPDLRAHGLSEAPHDPARYPDEILARDAEALIAHLALSDYDLGGFSLGARTTVRLLIRGATPRRAVLAGMGLEGLTGWAKRRAFFDRAIDLRDSVKRGDPHWLAIQFMKSQKIDPVAARLLLATFADTDPDALDAITTPTLIVAGSEDHDNGSAEALAARLPNATHVVIPGTHMSSVAGPELGGAIADFLKS